MITTTEFVNDVCEVLGTEFNREVHYVDPDGFSDMCFAMFMIDDADVKKKVVPWICNKYFRGVTPIWTKRIDSETEFSTICEWIQQSA